LGDLFEPAHYVLVDFLLMDSFDVKDVALLHGVVEIHLQLPIRLTDRVLALLLDPVLLKVLGEVLHDQRAPILFFFFRVLNYYKLFYGQVV